MRLMRGLTLLFFLSLVYCSLAQTVSLQGPKSVSELGFHLHDSGSREWTHPQKATLLSAVIPGAGQIYNKKYWKAGIVYAGAAGLIYVFKTNRDSMLSYQEAYRARIDGDSLTIDNKYFGLSDNSVLNYRNYHRQIRDMSILGFIGLYALQIIDANVDAHLREFRVNKDLSLTVKPRIGLSSSLASPQAQLSLFLHFK